MKCLKIRTAYGLVEQGFFRRRTLKSYECENGENRGKELVRGLKSVFRAIWREKSIKAYVERKNNQAKKKTLKTVFQLCYQSYVMAKIGKGD